MDQFPDIPQLIQLASSPAGQRLLAYLKQSDENTIQQAADHAKNGDLSQAAQLVSKLLQDPQAKALLQQLGGIK